MLAAWAFDEIVDYSLDRLGISERINNTIDNLVGIKKKNKLNQHDKIIINKLENDLYLVKKIVDDLKISDFECKKLVKVIFVNFNQIKGEIEKIDEKIKRIEHEQHSQLRMIVDNKFKIIELNSKIKLNEKRLERLEDKLVIEPDTVIIKTPPAAVLRENPNFSLNLGDIKSIKYIRSKVGRNRFVSMHNRQAVYDVTTGLMWLRSRYNEYATNLYDAGGDVWKLNKDKVCGYSNWRLPTLEEAMSLYNLQYKGRDYKIAEFFDVNWIWTADKSSSGASWVFSYGDGGCSTIEDEHSGPTYIAVRNNKNTLNFFNSNLFKSKDEYVLRAKSQDDLSTDEVNLMIKKYNFYCFDKELRWANVSGMGINNNFEQQNNLPIIYDEATNLTWEKSGSETSLSSASAKKYVEVLNKLKFGGHDNWRLPTLEEAMSLVERYRINKAYNIDPMFDTKQSTIWTSDKFSKKKPWLVHFFGGYCDTNSWGNIYVRAVCSNK